MKDNKELIAIAKEIQGKSDAMVTWKQEYEDDDWPVGEEGEWMSGILFDNEVKRLWVYVSYLKKQQLMFIAKINRYIGAFRYKTGDINTVVDNSKLIHTWKIETLYRFKNPITLQELKKYKNKKTDKYFKTPPQTVFYLSSYPELVKDIIAGKIE